MTVEQRLAELGIVLPESAAPPLAIYKPALRVGRFIYVSGQLPTRDGAVVHPGRLGDSVSIEQGQEAARAAAVNVLAAAKGVLGNLDGVRVVRTVGYVACAPDFDQHPQVVNGASALLRDVFGEDAGVGVRLALGVSSLPLNAPVEVEVMFEVQEPSP
jgi:enamine deaminase RidA (YjgF/YER057c/UK114 family)